jgi:hypothetical protein
MARSKTSHKQAATTAEKKTRERERESKQGHEREREMSKIGYNDRREEWRGSGELRKKMKFGWGIQDEDWISTSTAATYIFTVPTCKATIIITLKACASNAEFQHFIPRFF